MEFRPDISCRWCYGRVNSANPAHGGSRAKRMGSLHPWDPRSPGSLAPTFVRGASPARASQHRTEASIDERFLRVLVVLALVAGNAFFVIGEYAVVTARRSALRPRGCRARRCAGGAGVDGRSPCA